MNTRGVSSNRLLMVLVGIAVAGTVAGAWSFMRYARRAAPDAHRVAVAPFDIFAPGLDAWRVQLARDVTDRVATIPGWTAVPQETVALKWKGQDRAEAAAVEMARQTQAGVALYGRVDSLGTDSVRATVLLIDVTTTIVTSAIKLRLPRSTPNVLADSIIASIQPVLVGQPKDLR